MTGGETDSSPGLSHGVTGQAFSWPSLSPHHSKPREGLIWVSVRFAIDSCGRSMETGPGMFRGTEGAHTVRPSPRTRGGGAASSSTSRAESSAAREVGREEHPNPPKRREFLSQEEAWTLAAAPGNPGQRS